jgi:hypothetical protein
MLAQRKKTNAETTVGLRDYRVLRDFGLDGEDIDASLRGVHLGTFAYIVSAQTRRISWLLA